jgi:hypothetical protein
MRKASILLLALVALGSLLGAAVADAASSSIVISEFRTRGPAGGNDEFVEIWNNSGSAVTIGGWKLNGSNNAGTTSTRATVAAGVILSPGCYFLFTNNNTAGPYSGVVPGDQTYATGFTDDGGVAILDPANTIIDAAGMSAGSAYKEGAILAPTLLNNNQSYERKPGGALGNSLDTDNNASDFLFNAASSNPQNRSSGCLGATPVMSSTWGKIKIMYR